MEEGGRERQKKRESLNMIFARKAKKETQQASYVSYVNIRERFKKG